MKSILRGLAPLVGLLLLLTLGGTAAGCGQEGSGAAAAEADEESATGEAATEDGDDGEATGEGEEDDEETAVPVEVVALERGRIESTLRFSTHLEAESEVEVFSQAARQVVGLLVEEGHEVRRGQVLVRLQDEEQETQVARVESQLAKAEREYRRQVNLFEQQLISEQVFNESTYELEQLELALADARRELSYTEVKAPISGTITARYVNLGDQVTVNQHLFDIVDFDTIVARVYVPEKELARVAVGQPARITAEALPGVALEGDVERIAPRIDPQSGTFKVTVSVPRSEDLLPGLYVSVALVTDVDEEALLVPKRALIHDGDQKYVFRLVDDGQRVERLRVEPVLEDRHFVEPAGGLEPGDRIVVAGQAGVKDGSRVRVLEVGG